jgi:hypothetical protein
VAVIAELVALLRSGFGEEMRVLRRAAEPQSITKLLRNVLHCPVPEMPVLVHLLDTLSIAGKERGVLQCITTARFVGVHRPLHKGDSGPLSKFPAESKMIS